MKTAILSTRSALVAAGVVLLSLLAPARSTVAAQSQEATVKQIINDVQLLPVEGAPRPAAVNDNVANGTGVKTGIDSRTELTFADQTLARLSANTTFSFNKGTRNLDLADGAMLLRVPKGAGGAKITTVAITAAITGTTVIIEYHSHAYIKFISLEGTARVYLKRRPGESVLVRPGQMLITNPDAKSLPDPVDIDLDRLLKTSRLIVDFPPLGSDRLMTSEIQNQRDQKARGVLIDTNLVIFGKGTLVSLTNPAQTNAADKASGASAGPSPALSPVGLPPVSRAADIQR
jgi:quercetin dioxygenase-like cupin family protein